MNFVSKIKAEWVLRITLAAMYLYSGIDIVRNPGHWRSFVMDIPHFMLDIISSIGIDNFLVIQGIGEILIAVILLSWFMPKQIVRVAALLSTIEMVLITLMVGVDLTTFRDIGLIGPGLAIFLMKL